MAQVIHISYWYEQFLSIFFPTNNVYGVYSPLIKPALGSSNGRTFFFLRLHTLYVVDLFPYRPLT